MHFLRHFRFSSVKSGKIWGKCKGKSSILPEFLSVVQLNFKIVLQITQITWNHSSVKRWNFRFVLFVYKIQKSKQILRARVARDFSVFFIKTKTGYKKWGLLSLKGETKGKKCFNEISYIIWQKVWDPDGKWNRHCLHNWHLAKSSYKLDHQL